MKHNTITIAVLSYKFSSHPRAQRIAHVLLEYNFKVKAWEASTEKSIKRFRFIRKVLKYLRSMINVLFMKADFYWIENVPDIVYLPIALSNKKFIYDRRSPWRLEILTEYPQLKPLSFIADIIERFMIKRSCLTIVVSTPMLKEFNYNILNKHVMVIPNYPQLSASIL